ncbi:MAG: CerR family C-terminal domain-containing protein [Vicinamibacterales bacterium]
MSHLPKQRRGAMTRDRVIAAAIETFGEEGLAKARTRRVVERAGTNLVSIHYHFGSKDQLYCACAEHIARTIRDRSTAVLDRGKALVREPAASHQDLVECVCAIFDEFAGIGLSGGMPEGWRQFVVREQMEPTGTGAFELIFSSVRPFFDTVFGLAGRIIGRKPTDPEVRLLTTMIFGQISVFRTNQRGALKLMGWKRFGPKELAFIRMTARKYIVKLLAAEPARPPRARRPKRAAPAV